MQEKVTLNRKAWQRSVSCKGEACLPPIYETTPPPRLPRADTEVRPYIRTPHRPWDTARIIAGADFKPARTTVGLCPCRHRAEVTEPLGSQADVFPGHQHRTPVSVDCHRIRGELQLLACTGHRHRRRLLTMGPVDLHEHCRATTTCAGTLLCSRGPTPTSLPVHRGATAEPRR